MALLCDGTEAPRMKYHEIPKLETPEEFLRNIINILPPALIELVIEDTGYGAGFVSEPAIPLQLETLKFSTFIPNLV